MISGTPQLSSWSSGNELGEAKWQGQHIYLIDIIQHVQRVAAGADDFKHIEFELTFGALSIFNACTEGKKIDLKIEAFVMANGHDASREIKKHSNVTDCFDDFFFDLSRACDRVGISPIVFSSMSGRAKLACSRYGNPALLMDIAAEIAEVFAKIAKAVLKSSDLNAATERTRYANEIRKIQQRGIPCDVELLAAVRTDRAALWQTITNYYDPMQTVYRNGRFDHSAFAHFIDTQGIDFPLQATGKPNLVEFKDMAKAYPVLRPIYTLYKLDAQLRNEKLLLNAENRLIADLKPFATLTGRHAPSSNRFILGLSKQFRDLVTPEPGTALFMLDFVGQEIAIAAVLSGDQLLQKDYLNGDVYLTFAIHIGLVPESATKATHAAERELCKMIFIGLLYGMSAKTLALKLNCDDASARKILTDYRQRYPQLWQWQEALIKQTRDQQGISTAAGWRMFVDYSTKPTTIKNWLIQAVGVDILRKAILDCESAGLRVLAPLHDAILFESSLVDLDAHVHQAQTLMVNAAKHWLSDFPLRLDTQLVFPGQTLCPTNVTGLKHFLGATSQKFYGDNDE